MMVMVLLESEIPVPPPREDAVGDFEAGSGVECPFSPRTPRRPHRHDLVRVLSRARRIPSLQPVIHHRHGLDCGA